jgi:hypothetical protein
VPKRWPVVGDFPVACRRVFVPEDVKNRSGKKDRSNANVPPRYHQLRHANMENSTLTA